MKQLKRLMVFMCAIVLNFMVQAQQSNDLSAFAAINAATTTAFIGGGVGVNDYGIGANIELPLLLTTTLVVNVGFGPWGGKLGGQLTYYPNMIGDKSSFGIGYSQATGMPNTSRSFYVKPNSQEKHVDIDLLSVGSINLVYAYNVLFDNAKLVCSAGYAFTLKPEAYRITSNHELTKKSKDNLALQQPGGVIIGLKYMWGLRFRR